MSDGSTICPGKHSEQNGRAAVTVRRPSDRPATPLIEVDKLVRLDARTGTKLLHAIDFQLAGGDRIAISGPSGSGKSVFLRALAQLDALDGGRLLWRGHTLSDAQIPAYRRHVAYIAQRPALVDGSVEDNLRYPFSLKIYRDLQFDRSKVTALATQAGRGSGFLSKRAADLSGGEAQIVALIRVIQLQPDILLLDEPTASLDPLSAREIESLVEFWFDGGFNNAGQRPSADRLATRASIWVTHDPQQVRRVGSQHLTMSAGSLQAARAEEQLP